MHRGSDKIIIGRLCVETFKMAAVLEMEILSC